MMPTDKSLIPCPFCHETKGRPVLEELTEDAGGGWRVSCCGCHISTWNSPTRDEAIKTWNSRFVLSATTNKDWSSLLLDFHRHIGAHVGDTPDAYQDPEVIILRLRLMAEELGELASAMHDRHLEKIADGLADLAYVVIGTAVSYGLGPMFEEIFRDVHRSNMTKTGIGELPALVGKKYQLAGGKGAGYEPPRLWEIINRQRNTGEK